MKIFVASTGRCGTYFMTKVFQQFTNIPSFHEGIPKCINAVLEDVNTGTGIQSQSTQTVLKKKVGVITECSVDGKYFESNHMFIKSFYREVLDTFNDVCCIYLHRNLLDVLISFSQLPNHQQLDWLLQSHWRGNILRTREPLSNYQNIAWNWFEVRERFAQFRGYFYKTWDMSFENLNSPKEWARMFDHFGIKAKPEFYKLKEFPKDLEKNDLVAKEGKSAEELLKGVRKNWNKTFSKGWLFPTDISKLEEEKK